MKRIDLVVLAGGFGTRLRSAVADVPKPLAPVHSRPFLRYQIENWVAQGVERCTFLLHHQAGQIEAFLHDLAVDKSAAKCEFRTLIEPTPLGTGGAVANAIGRLEFSDSILITNADTWLGAGMKKVFAASAPAIAVVRVADTARFGAVRIDRGRIVAFEEKEAAGGAGWINAGLYHLSKEPFRAKGGTAFSLERDFFPHLLTDGRLGAVELETEFIDIGVPEDYRRYCRWIESNQESPL